MGNENAVTVSCYGSSGGWLTALQSRVVVCSDSRWGMISTYSAFGAVQTALGAFARRLLLLDHAAIVFARCDATLLRRMAAPPFDGARAKISGPLPFLFW